MSSFPVAQIRADRICVYNEFEGYYSKRGKNILSHKNLRRDVYRGVLSKVAKKTMETRLIAWSSAINESRLKQLKSWDGNRLKMIMITLTLPAIQSHSDKELKRLLLNRFIIVAARKWKIERYVWKAEAQENGNLHFHIITDKFVPKEELQGIWNSILSDNGYIDKFEKKHGHRNPPSTHVAVIRDLNMLSTYVQKYMSKSNSCRIEAGAIWGCSDNLKHLKSPVLYLDNQVSEFIAKCYNDRSVRVVKKDNCTIIFGRIVDMMKISGKEIYSLWREEVEDIWRNEMEVVRQDLIIPEVDVVRTGLSVWGQGSQAVGVQLSLPWH